MRDRGFPDPSQRALIVQAFPGFVVLDKPTGMLSVPGIGPDKAWCCIEQVRQDFPHATGSMMVHRLDMETSGLLVVALDAPTQASLSRLFEDRLVRKAYIALLDGQPARDEGLIDLPLRLDVERRPYQIVDFVHGRPAQTAFRVLSLEVDRARVRFEPHTGRTHQLRVHAGAPALVVRPDGSRAPGGLACPIVGDVLYGPDPNIPYRLMLHACELAFREPLSGAIVDARSPPPF